MKKLLKIIKWLTISISIPLTGLFVSVNLYINRDIEQTPLPKSDEYIYYYAYGSNMSTWYLNNIRHTPVHWSRYARLKDHTVMFNSPGINYLEPSFANLVYYPGGTAHGVVHKLNKKSFEKITNSESNQYQLSPVEVFLSDGSSVTALTLIGQNHGIETHPSERYLNIMIKGAREHKLPETYVQSLSERNGVYVPIMSESIGTVIYLTVISKTL